jgi:hypothetical protein
MKYLLMVLLLLPAAIIAQKNDVFKLSTSKAKTTKFASGWIALDSGWKFKAGDNPDWAREDFNDSLWHPVYLFQDLYDVPGIPKKGIVWFRIKLMADSSFARQLVMRIYQTGASEVYLGGKRIHTLGVVSSNSDSFKYYTPNNRALSFPLVPNAEQTLSIRFANSPSIYPIIPDFQKVFHVCMDFIS